MKTPLLDALCLLDIFEVIWKCHKIKWMELKKDLNITRSSFTKYKRLMKRLNRITHDQLTCNANHSRPTDDLFRYTNPFNKRKSLIDAFTMWNYLASLNFLHNVPWLNSLQLDLYSTTIPV
ncbi:hypothetical protein GLOIN_2v1825374 [Rhizophagus irregularis DAOM 181602=DAOM 197198]|nr:hypothetical protein GLOIN_2v1825374 [Rhizophagus irregularis DAOM 181602=DAOM 197198]